MYFTIKAYKAFVFMTPSDSGRALGGSWSTLSIFYQYEGTKV